MQGALAGTSEQLAVGAEFLRLMLGLLHQPDQLYAAAPDDQRRQLNTAFYTRIFVNEHGVADDEPTPAVAELHEAATAYSQLEDAEADKPSDNEEAPDHPAESFSETKTYSLADAFRRAGSSKYVLVHQKGLEPSRREALAPKAHPVSVIVHHDT